MKLRHFKSEQLKILYNQWIIRTTLSLGIFIPAMAIILNSSIKEITFEFIVNQMLQSFYLGQVGFVLLSALYFGQEFLNHTIRTSLLCESNRIKFMLTKIVNLIIWEAICILVFTVVSIFTIHIKYNFAMTSENILPLIKLLIPAYLSIFQLSLIEAGLIVLSGSVIFSLATVISMILGLGQLLLQFGKGFRTLPVLSVMNAFSSSHVSVYPKIGTGLLIQCGWCIGILIAGFHLLKEKSVR